MNPSSFRAAIPELDWGEDGSLTSRQFNDLYSSSDDPLAESTFVFIQGNHLQERWRKNNKTENFLIAELGFGTGLNFLNTWLHWKKREFESKQESKLHYIGIERFPLRIAEMRQIHKRWTDLAALSQCFLEIYDGESSGWHRFEIAEDVILDLYLGDAKEELNKRSADDQKIDAWYLDGFSPDRNPELWDSSLFQLIALHSHAKSTIATYSSAGVVRRGLEKAGFSVYRQEGFGRKRHMLVANGMQSSSPEDQIHKQAAWFRLGHSESNPPYPEKHAVVIGAGLAGSHAAFALSKRNWRVTVLEKAKNIAAGASGIPQLALRCRLFNEASPEAQFYLQAYLYALRFYANQASICKESFFANGLAQLASAMNKKKALNIEAIRSIYSNNIVDTDSEVEFSEFPASYLAETPIWFPQGGWADPLTLCKSLLESSLITVKQGIDCSSLNQTADGWEVMDEDDLLIDEAPVVILATGSELSKISQAHALPLKLSVGQSTQIEAMSLPFVAEAKAVVSGSRSLFPAHRDLHTISACYRQLELGQVPLAEDDELNIASLKAMFPELDEAVINPRRNHVAVRANNTGQSTARRPYSRDHSNATAI